MYERAGEEDSVEGAAEVDANRSHTEGIAAADVWGYTLAGRHHHEAGQYD
jgi:hypothetical protein